MSTEPDELYTLRAQYWLGHYQLALEEAKTIARRPMSAELKEEREEFVQRCNLALGGVVAAGDNTPALQALIIKSKYDAAIGEEGQNEVIDEMKTLVSSTSDDCPSVQLYAAQLFLAHGLTKDALQLVYSGATLEHVALTLQIFIKLDRIDDLATRQLLKLRTMDEDAVLTSLGAVHVALAGGSSTASDAAHYLNSLSEQYGPSPLLLNLSACAYLMIGDYDEAESKLLDCKREFANTVVSAETLINLIVASQYLGKPTEEYVTELKETFPTHPFLAGLERVEGAFAREAMKYKVAV